MADYRIYRLNMDDSIIGGADAKCLDDQAALDLARRLTTIGGTSEVWVGTKLVGRVTSQTANDIARQGRIWAGGRE